jgi:hypothetical protein
MNIQCLREWSSSSQLQACMRRRSSDAPTDPARPCRQCTPPVHAALRGAWGHSRVHSRGERAVVRHSHWRQCTLQEIVHEMRSAFREQPFLLDNFAAQVGHSTRSREGGAAKDTALPVLPQYVRVRERVCVPARVHVPAYLCQRACNLPR